MFCPTCGADVPESKYCANCGNPMQLQDGADGDLRAVSDQAGPGASGDQAARAVADFPVEPADNVPGSASGQVPGPAEPRRTGRAKLVVAGVVVVVAAVAAFFALSAPNSDAPSEAGSAAGQSSPGQEDPSAQADEPGAPSPSAGFSGTGAEARSSSGAAPADAAGSYGESASGARSGKVDGRAFDEAGNPTLFAVLDLDGASFQTALEKKGFTWDDSSSTWVSKRGPMVEVQGPDGLLGRDSIARLDVGGDDAEAAYVLMAAGYDTPQSALEGLSGDVVVENVFEGPEGDVVFAVAYGSRMTDHVIVVTQTGARQQTALVFTQDAVEHDLFSLITGVNSGGSIEALWELLEGKRA